MAVVRILGLDPGTQVVGYGCLEIAVRSDSDAPSVEGRAPLAMRGSNVVRAAAAGAGDVRLVTAGVLRLGKRGAALTARLLSLAQQYAGLLAELRPQEVAVEEAFYGKSAQAALRIGEARGVVLAESARAGLDVFQFTPARVKRCVAGHGAARKESVGAMLQKVLPGLTEAGLDRLPADATDALALAWTRLEERRSPLLTAAVPAAVAAAERATTRRASGR